MLARMGESWSYRVWRRDWSIKRHDWKWGQSDRLVCCHSLRFLIIKDSTIGETAMNTRTAQKTRFKIMMYVDPLSLTVFINLHYFCGTWRIRLGIALTGVESLSVINFDWNSVSKTNTDVSLYYPYRGGVFIWLSATIHHTTWTQELQIQYLSEFYLWLSSSMVERFYPSVLFCAKFHDTLVIKLLPDTANLLAAIICTGCLRVCRIFSRLDRKLDHSL